MGLFLKAPQCLQSCRICPRRCGVDRTRTLGYCGASDRIELSKVMLHHFEEPCISGTDESRGAGTVFFTHCPLGCIYCQNREISRRAAVGRVVSCEELAEIFVGLQRDGAYDIDLVSPTQYAVQLIEAVRMARELGLTVPVVWNTGGYELSSTIAALRGTVDVYLTDVKYASPELARRYSMAEDYPDVAFEALSKMVEQVGSCRYDEESGIMTGGVIVRHLVLPGCRADSIAVLRRIAEVVPPDSIRLSLMAQYTPEFLPESSGEGCDADRIRRRVTSFEYRSVLDEAVRLGFDGYSQGRTSASRAYTPDFGGAVDIGKEI